LSALNIAGGQLSQSQVTMGPLRHVPPEERDTVFTRLRKARFIEEVELKPARGRQTLYHRLTDKGRREIPASTI
jgi:hypothetical protein